MTEAEREIIAFLKLNPDTFFNRKEIARKARRRSEYEAEPHWAAAPLASLTTMKYVIQDNSGAYALSPDFENMKVI